MRYINMNGLTPVNTPANPDFPDWIPWTEQQWQEWLSRSRQYNRRLTELHNAGDFETRNDYINARSTHWGRLKEWLKVLSYGKCWFSEVRDLYSHYDVEHFRPKAKSKSTDGTERDAYWWLAFDYTNYRLCGNVGNRKKGNWFPLRVGSLISSFQTQNEESEEPYLLDPADADDVSLISFDEEGKAVPSPGATEWETMRVEETIKRLKLNEHNDLAEARRKVWLDVSTEIDEYLKHKARCNNGGNPVAREKVRAHCVNIRNMTLPNAELSSVARWCVMFRNDPQLSRLVA
ncbi:hypothetical protein AUR67_14195 [Pseudoalteromonas sp. XI10]|uniref:hypothetical protein n=1 Tax=Pseudoalteromonas sp. XI10 TaxID=1766621 RepID=UPI0007336198|nr:hypothetical protein [Pseudoalteromonas sp. XI10]KTG19678.1 hypothetical protein AUR67_14195 [Pseudoalteromonas sp. XI10]